MNCLPTYMHTIGNLMDYIPAQQNYIPDYKKIIYFLNDIKWQIRRPAIDF